MIPPEQSRANRNHRADQIRRGTTSWGLCYSIAMLVRKYVFHAEHDWDMVVWQFMALFIILFVCNMASDYVKKIKNLYKYSELYMGSQKLYICTCGHYHFQHDDCKCIMPQCDCKLSSSEVLLYIIRVLEGDEHS